MSNIFSFGMYHDGTRGAIHNVLVQKQKIPSSLVYFAQCCHCYLTIITIYVQHGQQYICFSL